MLIILKLATVKSLKADVLRISPSSEQLEELWVVFVFICRKWSYTVGENIAMTNSVASFSAYQHTHTTQRLLLNSLRWPIYVINSLFCCFKML